MQCLIYSGKGWIFIRFYSQFCMFQVLKWMEYAEGLSKDCFAALEKLNVELAVKSVVLGDGLTPSAADVAVFAALHSSVVMTVIMFLLYVVSVTSLFSSCWRRQR